MNFKRVIHMYYSVGSTFGASSSFRRVRTHRKRPKSRKGPHTHSSATRARASLASLIGKRLSGTIQQTGPHFVAVIVDHIDGMSPKTMRTQLTHMAQKYIRDKHIDWNVSQPRSWMDIKLPHSTPEARSTRRKIVGPNVSLNIKHIYRTLVNEWYSRF